MNAHRLASTVFLLALVFQQASGQQLPRLRRQEGVSFLQATFGEAVATIGDVDQDGVDDYVVGSPDESIGNGTPAQFLGVARVYSGATGAVIHTISGIYTFDRLGWSVGGGGDLNGDGVPDFVVGLPLGSNTALTGHVRAYSGATGTLLWSSVLGQLDGYRVATAGDVDGDGYADVITSSGTFGLSGSPYLPHVVVLHGSSGAVIRTISGTTAGATTSYDTFGNSLAGGVDFDLDGTSDIVVGFSSYGGLGNQVGAAIIYSGATGSLMRVLAGAPVFSFLGTSVALGGDMDGDGISEIVTGGTGNGSVSVPGIVRVYSGGTGLLLYSVGTGAINDGFGGTVAGGADLDGDGIPDFATSTPLVNPTGPQVPYAYARGAVRAYSGATGNLIGVIGGFVPGSGMGGSLAMLRDSNGDGIGELVSGNPTDDTALQVDGGSVEVVTFAGAQGYGAATGALHLGWIPGVPAAGFVLASGAGPSHAGAIAADLAPGNVTAGTPPITVYLGLTPGLFIYPITYDGSGSWGIGVDLRNPFLAGTAICAQAFDVGGPTIAASAGLQLQFCH